MYLQNSQGKKNFNQWDTGQTLTLVGVETCHEVHYCHYGDETALVCQVREDGGRRYVDVPNLLLQSAEDILAYLFCKDGEGTRTQYCERLTVTGRPKPEAYIYTETEVLSYSTLDQKLKDLEGEGLANALSDYLEKNPVETGATAEEAAQIAQNKTDIEQLIADKLDASELPKAVNEALAQAKASGVFQGEPGKDYTLTEADKQEIAELTAPLVDVPGGGGSGESYIAKLQTLASGTIPNGTAAGVTDTGLTIGDLRRYKYFVLYVSSKGQNVYWGLSWRSAWGCIGRYQHASLAFTYEWKDSNKTVLEMFVGYGTGYENGVGIHDNSSGYNPLLSKMPVLIKMGADSTPIYVQNGADLTVDATWEIKGCLEYES